MTTLSTDDKTAYTDILDKAAHFYTGSIERDNATSDPILR